MDEKLKGVISQLNKKYGKDAVCPASHFKGITVDRMPTGSFSMDVAIGGGFPRGRVIEVYGEEGSGKTTLVLKTIAECQKRKEVCVFVDNEGTFDDEWAKKCGVDLDKLLLVQKETAEQNLNIADAIIRSGSCSLLVLDSIASLMPQMEEEVSMEDTEKLGDRALLMNRFCRKIGSALNLREEGEPNKCCVILINQTREMIGKYGDPTTTPGGRGVRFTASVRVYLRRREWIKEGEAERMKCFGQETYFKVIKNKTYPGQKSGVFDIYNVDHNSMKAGEIDFAKEVVTHALLHDIIKQSGKFYSIPSKEPKGRCLEGKEAVFAHYRDNPDEFKTLHQTVMETALIK